MLPRTYRHTARRVQRNTSTAQPFFQPAPTAGGRGKEGGFFAAAPASVQAKLTVGQPGDRYEQEADTMADQVVSVLPNDMSAPVAFSGGQGLGAVQRSEAKEDEKLPQTEQKEAEKEQMKQHGAGDNSEGQNAPPLKEDGITPGSGQPLAGGTPQAGKNGEKEQAIDEVKSAEQQNLQEEKAADTEPPPAPAPLQKTDAKPSAKTAPENQIKEPAAKDKNVEKESATEEQAKATAEPAAPGDAGQEAEDDKQQEKSAAGPMPFKEIPLSTNAAVAVLQTDINAQFQAKQTEFNRHTHLKQRRSKARGKSLADAANKLTAAKLAAATLEFDSARTDVLQKYATESVYISARTMEKLAQATQDRQAAHTALDQEITLKAQATVDAAEEKALAIEAKGTLEAERAKTSAQASISRIAAIGKQYLYTYGSTFSGRIAADNAIHDTLIDLLPKIRKNGAEIAAGAIDTAQKGAAEIRKNGQEIAKGIQKGAADLHPKIEETYAATVQFLTTTHQGLMQDLETQKGQTLMALATAQQAVSTGIQNSGQSIVLFFSSSAESASSQIGSLGRMAWGQMKSAVGTQVAQLSELNDPSITELDLAVAKGALTQSIEDGSAQLFPIIEGSEQEMGARLQRGTALHQGQMQKYTAHFSGTLSTVRTSAEAGLQEKRTYFDTQTNLALADSQAAYQGGQTALATSLQGQIDEAKTKWAAGVTEGEQKIVQKVDEGLSNNVDLEASAPGDFQTVASKAADYEESSTAYKIVAGIASAVWGFIKSLGVYLLWVAIVFVVLFALVASFFGTLFALLVAGVLLAIAAIVVGIVMLVKSFVENIIIRTQQVINNLPAGHKFGVLEAFAVGLGVAVIAAGDTIGVTPIIESINGEEAITGRKLSTEERANKATSGVLGLATLGLPFLRGKGVKGGGPKAPVEPPVSAKPPLTPVEPPVAPAPVKPPAPTPVEPPVARPVEPPKSTPVPDPVQSPAPTPVEPPASRPVEPPKSAPVSDPVKPPAPTPVEPPAPRPVEPPKSDPVPSERPTVPQDPATPVPKEGPPPTEKSTAPKQTPVVVPKKSPISERALDHADKGDFPAPANPKKPTAPATMKGGGHGQANIDYLDSIGMEYNIVKTYGNGVRVGNIPKHQNGMKRTGTGQSWFPENWTRADIKSAGEHVVKNTPNFEAIPDGQPVYADYNGVRTGVIKTDGKPATIFPDGSQQTPSVDPTTPPTNTK